MTLGSLSYSIQSPAPRGWVTWTSPQLSELPIAGDVPAETAATVLEPWGQLCASGRRVPYYAREHVASGLPAKVPLPWPQSQSFLSLGLCFFPPWRVEAAATEL